MTHAIIIIAVALYYARTRAICRVHAQVSLRSADIHFVVLRASIKFYRTRARLISWSSDSNLLSARKRPRESRRDVVTSVK